MIITIMPDIFGLCSIRVAAVVILLKHPNRMNPFRCANDDLSGFSGRKRLIVFINDIDVVQRGGLAQRTDLFVFRADKVAHQHCRFGLAERLMDPKPGFELKLAENFRVKCLTGSRHIFKGRKVIVFQPFLNQEAVDGRRRTEGRNPVFLDFCQQVGRYKPVKVIDKNPRSQKPLSVQLAPDRLGPSGFRYRQMQPVRVDVVPVFCRHDMGNWIAEIMADHLRVTGRTGGKIKQHRIAHQRLHPLGHRRGLFDHRIKRQPAFPLTPNDKASADIRVILHSTFNMLADLILRAGDNRGHTRALETIEIILCGQQMSRRNCNRTQLMQPQNCKPELEMALKHQHDPVTPADALAVKKSGGTGSILADLPKGKAALFTSNIAPDHCTALRLIAGNLVDHIISIVEMLIIDRLKPADDAVLIKTFSAKLLMQQFHIHIFKSFPPPDRPPNQKQHGICSASLPTHRQDRCQRRKDFRSRVISNL